MASAWSFFGLVATVAYSSPIMKYSFCPLSNPQCEPTNLGSNSPFEFGNITSGVYYYERGESKPLAVSCTFHEPLQWILTLHATVRVNSISSSVATNGSHLLYYYHIQVNEATSGLIRCESYDDSTKAAEIFIVQRNQAYVFLHWESKIIEFLSRSPKRGGQLIVPCTMHEFDPSLDARTLRLKKLRQSDMVQSKLSPECFNCFPLDERDSDKCITSCPYNIPEKLWNDTGRMLGVNKTANQWLDCIGDSKCAFETVTNVPKFKSADCNDDGETTCSDHFSAISSYPDGCVKGSTSYRNFNGIEACVVKNLAKSLESTEADYDPRVGFRLKTDRDMDAVYICSSSTSAVYMSTYDPTKKIKARWEGTNNSMSGPVKGIHYIGPQKWMENFYMTLVACSTLFECELQLQTFEGRAYFRKSNHIVRGEKTGTIYPELFGKIIQNPPSSGVVRCNAAYTFQSGYIWDLQYFFTGLDSALYFLSKSVPVEAVISFREIVPTDLITSNGIQLEVECTVATFILFPSFEFQIEYSNGTMQTTERMPGLQIRYTNSHSASQKLKMSTDDDVSVVSIRCRAPFRNHRKEVEAVLHMRATTIKVDSSSSPQVHLAVVLIVASSIILLASVACVTYGVRKYKRSTELRQLTLEEMNEFLNGNAVLATGTRNEVNVNGIGFPECLQIPATDLNMDTQQVLGEGEFGRCVSADFNGRKVAVKTTKAPMNVEVFKEFLREVKVMGYIGKHENIVEFLGAVVNQLRDRTCLAVVELSPYGYLLSFLRTKDPDNPCNVQLYVNPCDGQPCEGSDNAIMGISVLSYFCEKIAAAMEFVGEKRVIHGDLAARNVLVFPDYRVKITDFGLSRKLYTALNYKKKNGAQLPWRWMALESFKYMEFSPRTDMWAYGVTAWEIFTMGQVPYAGLVYSQDYIDRGHRLPRPINASEEIYQFMKRTWDRIPAARPSFKEAKIFFRRIYLGIPTSAANR